MVSVPFISFTRANGRNFNTSSHTHPPIFARITSFKFQNVPVTTILLKFASNIIRADSNFILVLPNANVTWCESDGMFNILCCEELPLRIETSFLLVIRVIILIFTADWTCIIELECLWIPYPACLISTRDISIKGINLAWNFLGERTIRRHSR